MTGATAYLGLFVAALTSVVSGACNNHLTDTLWVPAEASLQTQITEPPFVIKGRHVSRDGSVSASFELIAERSWLSDAVTAHFHESGWRQRDTQYLNPHLPTAFKSGWQRRCACVFQVDAEGKPLARGDLFEWHGEWENDRGDVATYSFFAEGSHIRAYAAIIPASNVRAFERIRAGR